MIHMKKMSKLFLLGLFLKTDGFSTEILLGEQWEGKVVNVLSGNTLEVKPDSEEESVIVHLWGVVVPKINDIFEQTSKTHLKLLLKHEKVHITHVDQSCNVLLNWFKDTQSPNEHQIQSGMGIFYEQNSEDKILCQLFASLELEAQNNKKGFWNNMSQKKYMRIIQLKKQENEMHLN